MPAVTESTDPFMPPPVDEYTARVVAEYTPPTRGVKPVRRAEKGVALPIRDAAIGRYVRDQVALDARDAGRRHLRHRRRRDVQHIVDVLEFWVRAYEMVTSFAATHAGGFVSAVTVNHRAAYCEVCTFRRRREAPNLADMPANGPICARDRCYGYLGGTACDCPKSPLWRPATLPWMLRLRWFACPLGHWDRGGYVPAPPEAVTRDPGPAGRPRQGWVTAVLAAGLDIVALAPRLVIVAVELATTAICGLRRQRGSPPVCAFCGRPAPVDREGRDVDV